MLESYLSYSLSSNTLFLQLMLKYTALFLIPMLLSLCFRLFYKKSNGFRNSLYGSLGTKPGMLFIYFFTFAAIGVSLGISEDTFLLVIPIASEDTLILDSGNQLTIIEPTHEIAILDSNGVKLSSIEHDARIIAALELENCNVISFDQSGTVVIWNPETYEITASLQLNTDFPFVCENYDGSIIIIESSDTLSCYSSDLDRLIWQRCLPAEYEYCESICDSFPIIWQDRNPKRPDLADNFGYIPTSIDSKLIPTQYGDYFLFREDSLFYVEPDTLAHFHSPSGQISTLVGVEDSLLVTAHTNGDLIVWNLNTFEYETTLKLHDYPIMGLYWNTTDNTLISWDTRGFLTEWDISAETLIEHPETLISNGVQNGSIQLSHSDYINWERTNGKLVLSNPERFTVELENIDRHFNLVSLSDTSFCLIDDDTVYVFNSNDGTAKYNFEINRLSCLDNLIKLDDNILGFTGYLNHFYILDICNKCVSDTIWNEQLELLSHSTTDNYYEFSNGIIASYTNRQELFFWDSNITLNNNAQLIFEIDSPEFVLCHNGTLVAYNDSLCVGFNENGNILFEYSDLDEPVSYIHENWYPYILYIVLEDGTIQKINPSTGELLSHVSRFESIPGEVLSELDPAEAAIEHFSISDSMLFGWNDSGYTALWNLNSGDLLANECYAEFTSSISNMTMESDKYITCASTDIRNQIFIDSDNGTILSSGIFGAPGNDELASSSKGKDSSTVPLSDSHFAIVLALMILLLLLLPLLKGSLYETIYGIITKHFIKPVIALPTHSCEHLSTISRDFKTFWDYVATDYPYIALTSKQMHQIWTDSNHTHNNIDAYFYLPQELSNTDAWRSDFYPILTYSTENTPPVETMTEFIHAGEIKDIETKIQISHFDAIIEDIITSLEINKAATDLVYSDLSFYRQNFTKLAHPISSLLKIAFSSRPTIHKVFTLCNLIEVLQKYVVFSLLSVSGEYNSIDKSNQKLFSRDSVFNWCRITNDILKDNNAIADIFPDSFKSFPQDRLSMSLDQLSQIALPTDDLDLSKLNTFNDLFALYGLLRNRTKGHGFVSKDLANRLFPLLFHIASTIIIDLDFKSLKVTVEKPDMNFSGIITPNEFPVNVTNGSLRMEWNDTVFSAFPWIEYSEDQKDLTFLSYVKKEKIIRIAYASGDAIKPTTIG